MIIIGVDPGGTTGLCMMSTGPLAVVDHAQLPYDEAVRWLHHAVDHTYRPKLLLAVERFTISAQTMTGSRTGSNDAMHMVGACRALGVLYDVKVVLQTPADAKAAFRDEALRRDGWYNRVNGRHARDALRHALLAARRLDKTDRRAR